MSAVRSASYSLPLMTKSKRNRGSSLSQSANNGNPEEDLAWKKLPALKMTSILKKIGAGDRSRQMYIPNEEDQAEFKRIKMAQLSRQYIPHRYVVKEPYEGDLQDIVMDCYTYGQNTGKKSVWRKYRHNCDMLSFDTLKVLKKK